METRVPIWGVYPGLGPMTSGSAGLSVSAARASGLRRLKPQRPAVTAAPVTNCLRLGKLGGWLMRVLPVRKILLQAYTSFLWASVVGSLCRKAFPVKVRGTADPSASLGMTKERARSHEG